MAERKSEAVEGEVIGQSKKNDNHGLNIGRLFFGLILVLIGVFALAGNFGWLTVRWENLSQLWPLIIIVIGFSMIRVRSVAWKIISVLMGLAILAGVAWVMLGQAAPGFNSNIISQSISVDKASSVIKQANVDINTGASSINISVAAQDSIAKLRLQSNVFSISQASTVAGDTQNVTLATTNRAWQNWFLGNIKNSWDISLSQDLPVGLTFDIGASSLTADLSNAHLTSLDVKTGASSMSIRLGDLEKTLAVSIDAGASSISISVPSSSGVELVLQSGLTGKSIAGLDKTGDDTYQTANYDTAMSKININGKLGVSSFAINRY